ncbi:MAG TPA: hypothetical protein VKU41_14210 [Polyangiaceae bacterium]|nr:hypothetical protein [Polyangiaceae bacterium]
MNVQRERSRLARHLFGGVANRFLADAAQPALAALAAILLGACGTGSSPAADPKASPADGVGAGELHLTAAAPSGVTSASDGGLAPARLFVAQNAGADDKLHLLARAFANEDTEVVSFYEPQPGNVIVVASGRPKGQAQIVPSKVANPTDFWSSVAPGQSMPQALSDALSRQASGVGSAQLTSSPADAAPSVARLESPVPSEQAPIPKVLKTGYCDARWPIDFNPSKIMGCATATQPNEVPLGCNTNGNPFPIEYAAPVGSTAYPYGGCSCSGRTVQGLLLRDRLNFGGLASTATNMWENFATVCPASLPADFTINATGWNQTWEVNEDNYLWVEKAGTVSCFFDICTSTNDVPQFNISIYSYGVINYFAEAYGP